MTVGSLTIRDIENPKPEEIDLAALERNLWNIRRYSGDPSALVVRQHTWLVREIAARYPDIGPDAQTQLELDIEPILDWCDHHDDHEGILSDTPDPYKLVIASYNPVMQRMETNFDKAICAARGVAYPSAYVRQRTHFYDKLAGVLEWEFCLGRKPRDDQYRTRNWIGETEMVELIDAARARIAA